MRVWDKIQKQERTLPAAFAMGMIANGLAVSLERATAPIEKPLPQQHLDDGCVPIRLANGDAIRMKPLRAAAVVRNGVAVYIQETGPPEPKQQDKKARRRGGRR